MKTSVFYILGILFLLHVSLKTTSRSVKLNRVADTYLYNVDTSEISEYPASTQMYFYIKKYAREYQIPEKIAYSIAYQETRWQGPLDSTYNPAQTSYAGALGPMQIMPRTASYLLNNKCNKDSVKKDIALNIELSMKLLRKLHTKHKDWGKVAGAYNTGKPVLNSYAKKVQNLEYSWIEE